MAEKPLGQAHKVGVMVGVISLIHLPADDLAALEVENQIQVGTTAPSPVPANSSYPSTTLGDLPEFF